MALAFNGKGGGSGGGASAILDHKVTLASADILALGTTPFTLVPAVTGSIIVPLAFLGRMHYGTTTYSEAGVPRVFLSATTFAASGWGANMTGGPSIFIATLSTAAFYTASYAFPSVLADNAETLASLVSVPFRIDENAAVTVGDGTVDITTLYYLLTP